MPSMNDTLIGRVMNNDFSNLSSDIEKIIDKKIQDRVELKKEEIYSKIGFEPADKKATEEKESE